MVGKSRSECYNCGMAIGVPHASERSSKRCPKCDSVLSQQTDGSTVWVDIAHDGQTIRVAMQELERVIEQVSRELAQNIGLIVGNGRIREEVIFRLRDLEFRQQIIGFEAPETNRGQILIQLKR